MRAVKRSVIRGDNGMTEGRRMAMIYRLLVVNSFVWASTGLYMPFIGAYYTQQGITPLQVGVLVSIGPVISILIQPLWAYMSDRSGRHRLRYRYPVQ